MSSIATIIGTENTNPQPNILSLLASSFQASLKIISSSILSSSFWLKQAHHHFK